MQRRGAISGWTTIAVCAAGLLGGALTMGCQSNEPVREPARVAVPPPGAGGPVYRRERAPRFPADERMAREDDAGRDDLPPPPYQDVPIVNQAAPEQRAFVRAYEGVGRPRIVVFVNRTLEGQLVPVNPDEPAAVVERRRRADSGVRVENREVSRGDPYYRDERERTSRFETQGPGQYSDRVSVYLRPGQYDEVQARSIDYEAIENVLTDWLAADGAVEIVSPISVRDRLTDEQVKDLQSGRPRMTGEIAKQLDADILVQVQAKPTRQTRQGLEVRMIAEAVNIKRGGQSIARAIVDVPPPLDKPKINKFTRFLARKLMDGMIGTWGGYEPPPDAQQPSRPGQAAPGRGNDGARPAPGGPDDRGAPQQPPPPATGPREMRVVPEAGPSPSQNPGTPSPMPAPVPVLPPDQPATPGAPADGNK